MDANDLILKDEVFQIVGAAFSVLNELGHGLHEKPYENALVVELGLAGIPFEQQRRFPVLYKSIQVAECVPDLIAFSAVVVDEGHRSHHRPRARADDELPAYRRTSRRCHPQLQACQTPVGAHRAL